MKNHAHFRNVFLSTPQLLAMFASVSYVFNNDKAHKNRIFVACFGRFVHPSTTNSHAKEQTQEQQPKAVQKQRSFNCGVL